ncbi:MAG: ABC transporter substrate-binding protein [Bacillota bacterium]
MALFDRSTLFALLAPALATIVAGCGASSGGTVRIGLAGAFDDPIGRPMKLAAELAVSEINASGGIGGQKLELLEKNDYADPDSAVVVANALYNSDVSAVIGHLFSGTTLAAAPVYNSGSDPVVAVSPSSSSPEVSGAGPYTFRVCPSDDAHGAALARWVRDRLGLVRGTVLYLNNEYGRGVRQRFVDEFTRRGGEVLAESPYLGDKPDVSAYLDRIVKDGRSQFLVIAGNRPEAEEILQQAHRRGINVPVLGGDGLEGIEGAGSLAEGVYTSMAYIALLDTPANRKFVTAYRSRYPDAPTPNQPAAATYDAVYLLRDVIAKSGPSRRSVRDGVVQVNPANPFQGVTGAIAFDSLGDVPNRQVYIGVVHGGAVQLAEGQ